MQFVSTRGEAPVLGFSDAVLSGLASDGGLYLPETWPQISPAEIAGFAGDQGLPSTTDGSPALGRQER